MGLESASRPAAAADEEARAWAGLATAQLSDEFCSYWLTIQCQSIPGALAGLVLIEQAPNSYSSIAIWPNETHDLSALRSAAERALRDGCTVVIRASSGEGQIAHPVKVRGRIWGAVAVKIMAAAESDFARTVRALHWGSGWLETLSHRQSLERNSNAIRQERDVIEVMRIAAAGKGAAATGLSLANFLSTRLPCRRVAIGIATAGQIRVLGLSHAAVLDRKSKTAVALANAMEEALDQAVAVSYPTLPSHARRIAVAHRDLARQEGIGAVLSVVVVHENRPIGVITLERDAPETFDQPTVAFCESVADVIGPVLQLQVSLDRPIAGRIPRVVAAFGRKLLRSGYPTTKLATLLLTGLVAALVLVPTDYRVSGKASLEGIVQQAAVAPFDGFVTAAPHRAGDIVKAGDVLATLDTRELSLEALRYESQRDQARFRQQEAAARDDRATAAIQSAEADEAEAQRRLIADKIARARIIAPFQGLVVSGDLSQSLGAPVERGKLLFEIAPLDTYRVNLQIDERDIAHVTQGQRGRLVLTGFSSEPQDFTVNKLVSVAIPANGINAFRVEATLDHGDPRLRPGMEGVGKIDAGRRSFAWIWTHGFFDWVRLTLWKRLP